MFDIGGTELLVIAIVAIVVVGPKDLPRMLRTLGQFVGKAKMMAREFQTHFNEAAEEAGLDEVRKGIESVEREARNQSFGDAFKPLTDAGGDVKREIDKPAAGGDQGGAAADAATVVGAAAAGDSESEPEPEKKADAGSSSGNATPVAS